jgi:hypothetical protein
MAKKQQNTQTQQQTEQPATGKKVVRVNYGNGKKLEALPTDFDRRKHKPLKRTDFADDSLWLDWQAAIHEERAKWLRQQADDLRKMGDPEHRAKIKRLRAIQKREAALIQELKADGIDV